MTRRVKRPSNLICGSARLVPQLATTFANAGARHGDRVHVAFHENREIVLAQRFFGAVKMVEHVALRIDRRLGRVQIFRHVVAHGAAAEGDHFARFIGDGKHDAAAEAVVEAAALIAREKAGGFEQFFGIFRLQMRAAARRRHEGAKPRPKRAIASRSRPRSSR